MSVRESGPSDVSRRYGRGNRLLERGDTRYVWNDDGRLVEKHVRRGDRTGDDVWKYTWTPRGLLASVARPDGALVEFHLRPVLPAPRQGVVDARPERVRGQIRDPVSVGRLLARPRDP